MQADEAHTLDEGARADLWSERTRSEGAQAVHTWSDGPLTDGSARRAVESGAAWYVVTRLDEEGTDRILESLLDEAGATAGVPGLPTGIGAVRRHGEHGERFLFLMNHTGTDAEIPVGGDDLMSGRSVTAGRTSLPAREVTIIRER
ncbi:Beta-galactosidase C-terminal domain [Streptomyces atroolivaceus]|uniref:Beta-galactosidase C-terminal domain n=1 Tax=Streptomyces atroolivaceus TaxID=66869 RepID=A0ABV9VJ91_STRAZ|nr:Beta-galactosidase C-terminal domain [Streptomyces atroolivaceus]